MQIELHHITVRELTAGYIDNNENGDVKFQSRTSGSTLCWESTNASRSDSHYFRLTVTDIYLRYPNNDLLMGLTPQQNSSNCSGECQFALAINNNNTAYMTLTKTRDA